MGDKKRYSEYQRKYYQDHKEELKEYSKKYRKEHKENYKQYDKKYHIDHSENRKQYRQEHKTEINIYYLDNAETLKKYMKQYRQTPEGKATNQRSGTKRRASEREMINTLTAQEWKNILEEYDYRCAYCGCKFTIFNRETKDHVLPISKGGDNIKGNVVPACRSCNSKKHDLILDKKGVIK